MFHTSLVFLDTVRIAALLGSRALAELIAEIEMLVAALDAHSLNLSFSTSEKTGNNEQKSKEEDVFHDYLKFKLV